MNRPSTTEPVWLGVDRLTKSYGRLTALDAVSFSIRQGEILGLIGPNGAGKTTLFECLAGVMPTDDGPCRLTGSGSPRSRSDLLFYVPDGITPWAEQPLGWVLRFVIGFLGGRAEWHDEVVAALGLAPLLRQRIGALSKGQRKRALLGIGLLTPQPLLLIDEPFEGLDLRQSRDVAATLRSHVSTGRTLFLSIHQIHDASRFCDRFVLLSGGKICAEGTAAELTSRAAAIRGRDDGLTDFEEVFLALT